MSGKRKWSAARARKALGLAVDSGGAFEGGERRAFERHLTRAYLAGIKAANPDATGEFLRAETARLNPNRASKRGKGRT